MAQRKIQLIPADIEGQNGKLWGLPDWLLEHVLTNQQLLSTLEGCDLVCALGPELLKARAGGVGYVTASESQWELLKRFAAPSTVLEASILIPLAAHLRQLYTALVVADEP